MVSVRRVAPVLLLVAALPLLGAEKSTAGLNQLLWLAQGEIGLPERGKLDDSLAQRLVQVLGGQKRAINVWVDADRLAAYKIPILKVRDAVS